MKAPVLLLLCSAACLSPADERARRDETIGSAQDGAATVAVEDGLAAVRHLAPGELVLWAQAPALVVQLRPGGAANGWDVTVRNVLADAELVAFGLDGSALAVTLAAQPRPTEKRWRVETGGAGATLRLAPPDAGDLAPWRFVAMGDVQEAIDRVQDIFSRIAADPGVRFATMIGDLTERGSAAELERFIDEMEGLPIPMYATLGNHELGTRDDLFHDYFGRGSFSFDYRGVQLTFVDSASATIAPRVHEWLDGWLVEGAGRVHVVLMHVPPLDPTGIRNGGFANRGEGHALVGKLARGGIDLTLYGHIHTFQAFENAGIPAYITGGGGALPDRLDGIGRHYLTIDVDPTTGHFQTAVVRID